MAVILSNSVPIYLYTFVHRFFLLQTAEQPADAWRTASTNSIRRLRVYIMYFPVHSPGVTNMSAHHNLSPAMNTYHQHQHMRSSSASQKDYPHV